MQTHDTAVAYVPGPLHPDLFGGETPITIPVKAGDLKVFQVRVSWLECYRDYQHITVAAPNENAAQQAALQYAEERELGEDAEDYEVEGCDRLDRLPTEEEALAWNERRGGTQC